MAGTGEGLQGRDSTRAAAESGISAQYKKRAGKTEIILRNGNEKGAAESKERAEEEGREEWRDKAAKANNQSSEWGAKGQEFEPFIHIAGEPAAAIKGCRGGCDGKETSCCTPAGEVDCNNFDIGCKTFVQNIQYKNLLKNERLHYATVVMCCLQ